jgi:phage head maturation protease
MTIRLVLPGDTIAAETACGCDLTTDDTEAGVLAAEQAVQDAAQAPDQAAPTEGGVPSGKWAYWEGPVVFEGQYTGDSRKIGDDGEMADGGAIRWDTLPIPLLWARSNLGGHDGAEVVGRVDTLERRDDGSLFGTGPMDLGSELGREAYRQVEQGLTPGVSVDLDDVTYEVRMRADLMDAEHAIIEAMWTEEDPEVVQEAIDALDEVQGLDGEVDDEGYRTVEIGRPEDQIMVVTSGRLRGVTMVSIPAFEAARISVRPATDAESAAFDQVAAASTSPADETLVAGGYPVAPPTEWFADPRLEHPTPLTITDEGRVYGHAALWGTCHTGWAKCVQPPHDPSGYASFLLGALLTSDGTEVAVGHITMDTRHANLRMAPMATSRHYDDTGTTAADVTVGEDAHGIWFAGALRPGITPTQVRTLRSSPLSGDWRQVGTSLRLMALLAVNMPGFPVPRTSGALAASGAPTSLVAAGMLAPRQVRRPGLEGSFSDDDLRLLKQMAAKMRTDERVRLDQEAAALRARLNLAANSAKVLAFVGGRAA